MSQLSLVLHGKYQTESGYQVTIIKELNPQNENDAFHFERGYRFIAHDGGMYLPDGTYDSTQRTCLDLVRQVLTHYAVGYDYNAFIGEEYDLLEAFDPEDAARKFYKETSGTKLKSIYEVKDVTISEEKLKDIKKAVDLWKEHREYD